MPFNVGDFVRVKRNKAAPFSGPRDITTICIVEVIEYTYDAEDARYGEVSVGDQDITLRIISSERYPKTIDKVFDGRISYYYELVKMYSNENNNLLTTL